MRISLPLAVLGLATSLAAQKVCVAENETIPSQTTSVVAGWYAVKVQAPQALNVTAMEMVLHATQNATVSELRLYNEDPTTGRPNQLLASGPVIVNQAFAFYGTQTTPVPIAQGQNFFVAARIGSTGPAAIGTGFHFSQGVKTPHCFLSTASSTPRWIGPTGPMNSWAWRYRVYCDTHTGAWSYYGSAKPGSFGRRPIILGLGHPNLGNPITIQIAGAPRSAPAIMLLGMRADIPFAPFGTIYVFPAVVAIPGVLAGSPGTSWNLPIRVPPNPAITGGRLAVQSLILDSRAVQGLSHTSGLEITVGN